MSIVMTAKLLPLLLLEGVVLAAFASSDTRSLPLISEPMPVAAQMTAKAAIPLRRHCMFVVAGKKATYNGETLMFYNNDWDAANAAFLEVIPRTTRGHLRFNRYLRLYTYSDIVMGAPHPLYKIGEGGINEYQVSLLFGVATTLASEVYDNDPTPANGYGLEMWDILLARSHSANDAVELISEFASARGFKAEALGSFAVADPDEVWVIELLGGTRWVAARVPDDSFYAQSNMLRIRQINMSDPSRFRGSPDLVEFATRIGRYDPATGPFDVAWAYGDRSELTADWNTNRLWRAVTRLSNLHPAVDMPYADRPVFVHPQARLAAADLKALARDHYEHTMLDTVTPDYDNGSPHPFTACEPDCCWYSTCNIYTDYSAIWEMRRWLPDPMGGLLSLGLSRPCSSTYVPFYAGVTYVPSTWSIRSPSDAFVSFRAVADNLDQGGLVSGQPRYQHSISSVRAAWQTFESQTDAVRPWVEATALNLWNTSEDSARAYLAAFSASRAQQAQADAETLLTTLEATP
jgi:dipeptidase